MANEQYRISVVIDGEDKITATLDKTNQKLRETANATDEGARSAKSWGEAWGVSSAGLLAASAVIGTAIVQLNQLGTEANAAEKTFTQVTGGADEAAASLARMRQATGGIIDDMTLMKGASSLLVTGIAQTNEQAEELVNLGSRLSAVMGVDAAEGIQNLNSALLNNSFMRLDTLGISAAAVRERVNELKEAGMDMSAAFSQAVLEIGTQTLTDLGSAASVAETSVARLTTGFQNLAQNLGQQVNVEIEKMATTLEQLGVLWNYATTGNTGIASIDAQIAATNELIAVTDDYIAQREYRLTTQGVETTDPILGDITAAQAVNYAQANADQLPTISTGTYFTDAISGDSADIAEARRILEELLGFSLDNKTSQELLVVARDADIAFSSITDAQAELAAQTAQTTQAQEEQAAVMANANELANLEMRDAALAQSAQTMEEITTQQRELNQAVEDGVISTQGNTFFNPDKLAEVQAHAVAVTDEYERLKMLAENDELSMISPDDLERAKQIAEQANVVAETAERNAAAWEKASLAMIAGAQGGGRQNEFDQMVLANIEDPEQRAAAQRQLELQSGVQTANTDVLAYGADLVAQVFSEVGTGAGQRASENFRTAFEDGIAAGLEGAELKDYIEEQVGYELSSGMGGGQQSVTVQAGEGYIALSQRTGISQEDLQAATGGTMLQVGQVITVGDGTTLVAVSGSPEDLAAPSTNASISNVLNNVANPVGSTTTAQPMPSDYTYYDPATGSYSYVNDVGNGAQTAQANQVAESIVSEEEVQAVASIQEDVASIDEGFSNISEYDLTEVAAPLVADSQDINTELTQAQGTLNTLTNTNWQIQIPVSLTFDTITSEMLSRNPAFVEAVRLVNAGNGSGGSGDGNSR